MIIETVNLTPQDVSRRRWWQPFSRSPAGSPRMPTASTTSSARR
jgi:hypothetical protein